MFLLICLHALNSGSLHGSLYYQTGPAVIGSINSVVVTLPLVLYMSVCLFDVFIMAKLTNELKTFTLKF
jgi:hypothetical protein